MVLEIHIVYALYLHAMETVLHYIACYEMIMMCCIAKGEDLREENSPSWFNPVEAVQVMKYLQAIVDNKLHDLSFDDIGIITPYRKQVISEIVLYVDVCEKGNIWKKPQSY